MRVSVPEERHQGVDVAGLSPPAEIGTQRVGRRHETALVQTRHALTVTATAATRVRGSSVQV